MKWWERIVCHFLVNNRFSTSIKTNGATCTEILKSYFAPLLSQGAVRLLIYISQRWSAGHGSQRRVFFCTKRRGGARASLINTVLFAWCAPMQVYWIRLQCRRCGSVRSHKSCEWQWAPCWKTRENALVHYGYKSGTHIMHIRHNDNRIKRTKCPSTQTILK